MVEAIDKKDRYNLIQQLGAVVTLFMLGSLGLPRSVAKSDRHFYISAEWRSLQPQVKELLSKNSAQQKAIEVRPKANVKKTKKSAKVSRQVLQKKVVKKVESSKLDKTRFVYMKTKRDEYSANNRMPYSHRGFKVKRKPKLAVSWSKHLKEFMPKHKSKMQAIMLAESEKDKKKAQAPVDKSLSPTSVAYPALELAGRSVEDVVEQRSSGVDKNMLNHEKGPSLSKPLDSMRDEKVSIHSPSEKFVAHNKESAESDDLILIDLDKDSKKPDEDQQQLSRLAASSPEVKNISDTHKLPISPSVKMAIQRELNKKPNDKWVFKLREKGQPKLAQFQAKASPSDVIEQGKREQPQGIVEENVTTHLRISARDLNFGEGYGDETTHFSLRQSHQQALDLYDDGKGIIELSFGMFGTHGVLGATLFKQGYMPVNLGLPLAHDELELEVPMVEADQLRAFLDKNQLSGYGGFVLIHLSEQTSLVDLASKYEERLFFDENFQLIKDEEQASFVLYVGVDPGNATLSFKTVDNRVASKVIHIREQEFFFERNDYAKSQVERFQIEKERLFGKNKEFIEIRENEIKFYDTDITSRRRGLNIFEINTPMLPAGFRKYLEFNHESYPIYVGRWDQNKLALPSADYISQVYKQFDIDSLNRQCMVQLNLSNDPSEIEYMAYSNRGVVNLEALYLDEDGLFFDAPSVKTKKAFFLGNIPGIVNLKVSYTDGTVDFLESFCSDETYLIEQL